MIPGALYQDQAGSALQTLMAIQHREILDSFEEAFRLYREDSADAMLIAAIDRIHACVRAHFEDEELLDSQPANYASYAHREVHQRALVQIGAICQRAGYFDREDSLSQLLHLNEWLQDHIFEETSERA